MEENTKATKTVEEQEEKENTNEWYDYVLMVLAAIVLIAFYIIRTILKVIGFILICFMEGSSGPSRKKDLTYEEAFGLSLLYHDMFCDKCK